MKVKITTLDGQVETRTIQPGEEAFYDDLPFTSSNVQSTEITE